jgi:hypothetical protein
MIQSHSGFRSGTVLMSHLAQMNKLSPRQIRWFIQVHTAGGYHSEMSFLTVPKDTNAVTAMI